MSVIHHAVIRRDDNGHTFVHTRDTDARTAESVRGIMHARAHKQDWRVVVYGDDGLAAALSALGLEERA